MKLDAIREVLNRIDAGETVTADAELVAELRQVVAAQDRKAERAAAARRKRSSRVREGITACLGELPLNRPLNETIKVAESRIQKFGPDAFGLPRFPDSRTLRRHIEVLRQDYISTRNDLHPPGHESILESTAMIEEETACSN